MNEYHHPFKDAVALIQAGGKRGTGYLVAPDCVATCAHVVEQIASGGQAQLEFNTTTRTATVSQFNPTADAAILNLSEPLSATPLRLAGRCRYKAPWDGFGFPAVAGTAGIPIEGVVLDPESRDDQQVEALVLRSPEVAAGMASPVGGFSGGPVVVQGYVIGHLKRIIRDPTYQDRPAFGLIWATPAAAVASLLGNPPAVAEIEPTIERGPTDDLAALGEQEYHVFVSYRQTDRRWAMELVERLEGEGLKVFIDQKELESGEPLGRQLHEAIARSRTAVMVMSKTWLESRWCQEESSALHQRTVEDDGFLVVPVRIDDCTPPPEWPPRTWIDFNGRDGPGGEAYYRLLYALTNKVVPLGDSADRLLRSEIEATDELFQEIRAAAAANPNRVYALWQQWHASPMRDVSASLCAAESLIQLGRPDQALEILEHAGDGMRAKQLRALALAKRRRLSDAITILEKLKDTGAADAETGGILAGRYRQRWLQTGNSTFRDAAFQTYLQTYEATGDTYPGINAAALALQIGDRQQSQKTARQVLGRIEALDEKQLDHWQLATAAEAHLLLADLEEARRWYRLAVAKKATAVENIATMRRSARQDLKALGRDPRDLDDVLAVPRIAAFAGHMTDAPTRPRPRFPEDLVGKVRLAIREKLKELGIGYGFSSAARGSDILFLEEVLDRGGHARVFLPFPQEPFAKTSAGYGWNERYHTVMNHERVRLKVLSEEVPPDAALPAAFDRCSREVNKAAIEFARMLDEEPVFLTVWNGDVGDGTGGTADAVRAWREEGYDPIRIDISTL